MSAPAASASSRHPLAAAATGEVAGALLEAIGAPPDVAVVAVSPHHGDHLADVAATVATVLGTAAVVAVQSPGVFAGDRTVADGPVVSGWAGSVGPARAVHLTAPAPTTVRGWPDDLGFRVAGAVILGDVRTADGAALAAACDRWAPGAAVAGGMVAPGAAGGPVLATAAGPAPGGAVALLLGRPGVLDAVGSHGARPFGPPATVTGADGTRVTRIAAGTALDFLVRASRGGGLGSFGTAGVHLGVVVRDGPGQASPADVVVRTVVAVDRASGSIDLDVPVPVGATVQCHGRDAASARAALEEAVAADGNDGVLGALVFADASRRSLPPGGHDDAAVVGQLLDHVPVAGMVTVGTFGPAGGATYAQRHAVSVARLLAS